MIHALGMSNSPFAPYDPGRLCRGRERWIDPWEVDGTPPGLHRLVISGAAFTDDSAGDARRGVPFANVTLAQLMRALFPDARLLAFMEDGHPADIPAGADPVEAYTGYRAGGRAVEALVRWTLTIDDDKGLAALLQVQSPEIAAIAENYDLSPALAADILANERVRGFAVLGDAEVDEEMHDRLFRLVGMSTLDSPPARFQPAALPELLERVPAIVALHRDKHGPAVAVYTAEPLERSAEVQELCANAGSLWVPFAIPPMLARWDRALSDLRKTWDEATQGPFPVPESEHPSTWEGRRRRRGGRRDDDDASEQPPLEDTPVAIDEDLVPDILEVATDDDEPEGDDPEGDDDDDDDVEGDDNDDDDVEGDDDAEGDDDVEGDDDAEGDDDDEE